MSLRAISGSIVSMGRYKRIGHWAVDYVYMLRGRALMMVHKNPPKHYLGYVLPGKAPVILIPGILLRWSFMKHLGDSISLAGHPVYIVPGLKSNLYSIPISAKKLRAIVVRIIPKLARVAPRLSHSSKIVRDFLERYNIKEAVLVAHSKGGLIGKYLLVHDNQDHRVKGMVAIATPFSGSSLARLISHGSFKELRADSKILHDLASHPSVNQQIISLIPQFDNHVWAEKGSFLEGADNIVVDVSGHHRILFDTHVREKVLESIERISARIQ